LGEIKGFAEDAAEIARAAAARSRMGHLDDKEKGKALDKLGSVNKSISKSEVKEVAGFLFPETDNWAAEISSVTTDPFNSHLEFSGRFYRALADAAAYNLQIISKVPDVKADIFNTGREILHKV
ncbi:MAG: hypothetical protein LBH42_01915, partial [Treponema sp.]|nr:hypothetical protein [Treponema sp.]